MQRIDFSPDSKHNTSVIDQLNTLHKKEIVLHREYLKRRIKIQMFTTQQNMGQRCHDEDYRNLDNISEINHNSFLELLYFRSKDIF